MFLYNNIDISEFRLTFLTIIYVNSRALPVRWLSDNSSPLKQIQYKMDIFILIIIFKTRWTPMLSRLLPNVLLELKKKRRNISEWKIFRTETMQKYFWILKFLWKIRIKINKYVPLKYHKNNRLKGIKWKNKCANWQIRRLFLR